jgi:hypothetical protein
MHEIFGQSWNFPLVESGKEITIYTFFFFNVILMGQGFMGGEP